MSPAGRGTDESPPMPTPTPTKRAGAAYEVGAVPSCAVVLGDSVAAGFGDGLLCRFHPERVPQEHVAHGGAILSMAAHPSGEFVLTGGDDGRLVRTDAQGEPHELESFGSRWVDAVAVAANGAIACSVGRTVHLWDRRGKRRQFDHPSTVGGLAFDRTGKRLAAAHYGGVTVRTRGEDGWIPTPLPWPGSHLGVKFSPDGDYLVSTMQENALHGWRLSDGADMRMAGYPTKIRSLAWVGAAPYLVTSGADHAVCWSFAGKNGPMGRAPLMIAGQPPVPATAVTGVPGRKAIVVGFRDGTILHSALEASAEPRLVRGRGGAAIECIAVTPKSGWLFAAAENGHVLWAPLAAVSA